jgi:hypothetical protein
MLKLGRIVITGVLATGLLTAPAACGGKDDYSHCYDANGNYDDDITGCPDDDPSIPKFKTPKKPKTGKSKTSKPKTKTKARVGARRH